MFFDEVLVKNESIYVDKQLKNTYISTELNLLIIALQRKTGEMIYQSLAKIYVSKCALLIVIGKAEAVGKLVQASE